MNFTVLWPLVLEIAVITVLDPYAGSGFGFWIRIRIQEQEANMTKNKRKILVTHFHGLEEKINIKVFFN